MLRALSGLSAQTEGDEVTLSIQLEPGYIETALQQLVMMSMMAQARGGPPMGLPGGAFPGGPAMPGEPENPHEFTEMIGPSPAVCIQGPPEAPPLRRQLQLPRVQRLGTDGVGLGDQTGADVADATFTVEGKEGTFTTGADGTFCVDGLVVGDTVTVTETESSSEGDCDVGDGSVSPSSVDGDCDVAGGSVSASPPQADNAAARTRPSMAMAPQRIHSREPRSSRRGTTFLSVDIGVCDSMAAGDSVRGGRTVVAASSS